MDQRLTEIVESLSMLRNPEIGKIGAGPFTLVLLLSLACGVLVAVFYRRFYAGRETGSQIHRAFPLLAISITAIFICIQFSLPLSLGLLGALSIVRFRTPIKEPEEIGFLMVVIATSLACATFNFMFMGIILAVALAALTLREVAPGALRRPSNGGLALVTLSPAEFDEHRATLVKALEQRLPRAKLESLSTTDGEVVLAYSFRGLESSAAIALEEAVSGVAASSRLTISYERGASL